MEMKERKQTLVTENGFEFVNSGQNYWQDFFSHHIQDGSADKKIFKDTFDANCQFYYLTHDNDFACLRCKTGYDGEIKHWHIDKCKEYNVETKQCISCLA